MPQTTRPYAPEFREQVFALVRGVRTQNSDGERLN